LFLFFVIADLFSKAFGKKSSPKPKVRVPQGGNKDRKAKKEPKFRSEQSWAFEK
jgi:hypothetical protein